MGLLDRIATREECHVGHCHEEHVRDALFCSRHLSDLWSRRLLRLSDGTYAVKAGPVGRFMAKELSPA